MNLELERLELGPWPMNCYLVRCPASGQAVSYTHLTLPTIYSV